MILLGLTPTLEVSFAKERTTNWGLNIYGHTYSVPGSRFYTILLWNREVGKWVFCKSSCAQLRTVLNLDLTSRQRCSGDCKMLATLCAISRVRLPINSWCSISEKVWWKVLVDHQQHRNPSQWFMCSWEQGVKLEENLVKRLRIGGLANEVALLLWKTTSLAVEQFE